ncbi:MAG: tetratricopeptide repeat protein [Acidobacteriia bacterium]|nr:tetratricopeptide repeat protein [Terriglobia bacterium]
MAAYREQRYAEALEELEWLLPRSPESFDVNELAGLVYVALSQDNKANPYLAKGVRLNPRSAPARTTLATNLMSLHRTNEAEAQFQKAVELEPDSYDANHNLGEYYVQMGRLAESIPYLRHSQQIKPTAYNNGYDLALALVHLGRIDEARLQLQKLLKLQDTGELHSLLGEVEEKAKNYVAAARQYELSARLDPSESNIFNWGAELLLHQTLEPAIAVFKAGLERYPQSIRLYIGLGIAYSVSPTMADQVRAHLRRFMKLAPRDASAPYYYAMSLWQRDRGQQDPERLAEVESLLESAIRLDPQYTDAYLELGLLYASQHNYGAAIDQYRQALKTNSSLADAHYRLGQALVRMGDTAHAQQEFAVF